MGRTRLKLASCLVAMLLGVAAPGAAQDEAEPAAEPGAAPLDQSEAEPAETSIVRDDDTSDTVQRIRRELVAVAILTTAGLVVFVWHTNPGRRLRVASARAERSHAQAGGETDDETAIAN